jgi:hypothetical protein
VAGSCEYGDELAGSGATELVAWLVSQSVSQSVNCLLVGKKTPSRLQPVEFGCKHCWMLKRAACASRDKQT